LLSTLGGIGNSTFGHFVEPCLELLNHEGFDHIAHTAQRVDQLSAIADGCGTVAHLAVDAAHFLEDARQAIKMTDPWSLAP
jgi:hypothetical protein